MNYRPLQKSWTWWLLLTVLVVFLAGWKLGWLSQGSFMSLEVILAVILFNMLLEFAGIFVFDYFFDLFRKEKKVTKK